MYLATKSPSPCDYLRDVEDTSGNNYFPHYKLIHKDWADYLHTVKGVKDIGNYAWALYPRWRRLIGHIATNLHCALPGRSDRASLHTKAFCYSGCNKHAECQHSGCPHRWETDGHLVFYFAQGSATSVQSSR